MSGEKAQTRIGGSADGWTASRETETFPSVAQDGGCMCRRCCCCCRCSCSFAHLFFSPHLFGFLRALFAHELYNERRRAVSAVHRQTESHEVQRNGPAAAALSWIYRVLGLTRRVVTSHDVSRCFVDFSCRPSRSGSRKEDTLRSSDPLTCLTTNHKKLGMSIVSLLSIHKTT